jgi:hypothetical protein
VIKQIKDSSPDEHFLLVLDTLGCFIAESSDIPMNKVTIIPSNTPFHGKKVLEFPATLHSLANGISTDKKCFYQDIVCISDLENKTRQCGIDGDRLL